MRRAAGPDEFLILIPAYNEQAAIAGVLKEIDIAVPHAPVLVIDDCSPDSTYDVARAAGAEVMRLPHHLGLGGCVQAGYKFAFELGYDYVIRVDGDGQHNPQDVPRVLAALKQTGYEMIIGSRFCNGSGNHTSAARGIGIRLFRLVLRPILGKTGVRSNFGFCGSESRGFGSFHAQFSAGIPGDRNAGGTAAQEIPLSGDTLRNAPTENGPKHDHRLEILLLHRPRSARRFCECAEI